MILPAKQKQISAKEFELETLEEQEDIALSAIADTREKKNKQKTVDHKNAWEDI